MPDLLRPIRRITALVLAAALAGCGEHATLPDSAGFGPTPVLPEPHPTVVPTVNIPRAVGWPAGRTPVAADGLTVTAYATGLAHPRWLHVLPNGDVLVAETNAPASHDEAGGFRAWIAHLFMKRAGAASSSADRITLLRGLTAAGAAAERHVLLTGLHSPFGMADHDGQLYVANTDAVVRFPFHAGDTEIHAAAERVCALPAGPINHHWTKDLILARDGAHLYVTVGSNSNVAENGLAAEEQRAAVLEVDLGTGATRVFASGLRNPNGLAFEPVTGALWVAVNERDELGSDLVPDYMTSVRDGGFYGWPYSYYGAHVDTRVRPPRAELVARAIVPDYALGAHTASLGLAFYTGEALPAHYRGGAFVGQHGSWNRRPTAGYRVIFVPFDAGRPAGPPETVLDGFLGKDGVAYGRPVGVAVDATGALLVADDVGDTVWRIARAP